jgi:outer membrane immunogenic protein
MIKTIVAASIAAVIALPAAALAQEAPRGYATLGYSQIDTEQAVLGAITARAGWKVLPYVGVEGEASFGIDDEPFEVSIDGAGAIELKHDYAAYAVAFLPLGQHIELFARAGYGSTSIESTVSAVSVVGNGESFNYGVGATAFYGANGVRADWTRKDFSDNGGEADSWSVSYVRRF